MDRPRSSSLREQLGLSETKKSAMQSIILTLPLSRSASLGLGSAGVAPAVFGLWPETLLHTGREPLDSVAAPPKQSAGRRLMRPGRSRSPFSTETFRPNSVCFCIAIPPAENSSSDQIVRKRHGFSFWSGIVDWSCVNALVIY